MTAAVGLHARVPGGPETDPRVYFAAERTLLAWIRTGLAMMGFGFVVARFALYLGELSTSAGSVPVRSSGGSLWFGTALVLVGALVNLSAALEHRRLVRQLRAGSWSPDRTSRSGITVAIALVLVGLVVTIHLLWVRS
jgi:putative membrane protein